MTFYTHAWRTAMLYALLTIPTFLLIAHCAKTGMPLSDTITNTWQATFWQFPGLSSKISRVVADMGVILITLGAAWTYVQGYLALRGCHSERSEEAPLGKRPMSAGDPSASLGMTEDSKQLSQVLMWAAIFALILAFVVPFHSRDIYGYINRGAQQAFYGVNPYIVTVSMINNWQHDPMFHKHWITNPSPYGFFFTQLTNVLTAFSGREFWSAFMIFKNFNVLVHIATAWMVYQISRTLGLKRPVLNAYLYAWNPLMLLHLVANGHNDGLLALFLLVSLWLAMSRHAWAALPALTLSVFTKYASLLAGPFVVAWFIKQKAWRSLAFGLMYSVMLVVLLGWPYLQDIAALPFDKMADNAGMSQHSMHSALSRTVFMIGSLFTQDAEFVLDWARVFFKWMLWGGFVFVYGWMVVSYLRDTQSPQNRHWPMVYGIAFSMAVMVAFVSSKFHAWYVAMFFPLVLLLDSQSRLRQFGLLLTLFQLLAFLPLENLHVGNFLILTLAPLVLTRYITLFRE